MFRLIFGLILLLIVNQGFSNDILETQQKRFETLALQLWDYAELGYLEVRSSNLLQEELKNEGFKIENNEPKKTKKNKIKKTKLYYQLNSNILH